MGSTRWGAVCCAMLVGSVAHGEGLKQATFDGRHELEVAIPEGAQVVRIWFTEPQADAASEIRKMKIECAAGNPTPSSSRVTIAVDRAGHLERA